MLAKFEMIIDSMNGGWGHSCQGCFCREKGLKDSYVLYKLNAKHDPR